MGHLEGTQKALHTIKNYRSDLRSFENFLKSGLSRSPVSLADVTQMDLEKFLGFLKAQGFKTNTRRRKLLTIRKMLRYLTRRDKLRIDVADHLPAPSKMERLPLTVSLSELVTQIRSLPHDNEIHARNRALLWTLAETGALVSEVSQLKLDHWSVTDQGVRVRIEGKSPREIPVSRELFEATRDLKLSEKGKGWLFPGHNKFGALGAPMTPRGIELLVKSHAERLGTPMLTPRTFRHSAVLHWHSQGLEQKAIQERLGLKTDYAFRTYRRLFKTPA